MHIDSYKFGNMVVNGINYTNDLKIFPDEVKSNWWRESGHNLSKSDIKDIIDYKPDVLIIGTGKMGVMKVSQEIKNYIRNNGIKELHVEKSAKAVKLYNQEKNENKVAAFHLTC
ncbi:MAG: MTH938/NDUFAF3 family protein [Candidatus Marinimicrobia bacterium]|nr:MTH938/NDUFAF3 family protein [Candidatus Neomarinimicrobiota bacterium]